MKELNSSITILLNDEDKKFLQQLAEKNNLTTTSFCRFVLLKNNVEEEQTA